jgi:hypothetical protein
MKITEISHLLNELGVLTIRHVLFDSDSLIPSIKNRIYRRTAVAHSATKYYLADDRSRDREINLSYVPTAKMLADYFTNPLTKPAFVKQCAAMEMIGNAVGNGLRIGIGNRLRNCHGNGIRSRHGIGNAVGK